MSFKWKWLICVVSALILGGSAFGANEDDWNPSVLRPGDVLQIEVFRMDEFSKSVRIEEDGSFMYPLCGEIKAAGLTPRDISKEMAKRLAAQIANPQVTVFVSSWSPRPVYILGEVKGSMSLELPTYGRMTVLQAISASGGFTESADLNGVVVLRRIGNKLERLKVDVSALATYSNAADDFRLRPEDTLIVPKAPPVFVAGEVNSATVMYVDTQRLPMCSEVMIRCGGLKDGADAGNVLIVRTDRNGEQKLLRASLLTVKDGLYVNDIQIQPGDSIMVPSADQIQVFGEVNKPGPLVLGPTKVITISQAIALAGGFTKVAKESNVTLIRGKEMKRFDMRNLYEKAENDIRDFELHNGDIIFVRESFW